MKAKAKFFRGIEFICVSDLPAGQQLLLQHAREPERIKILMDGKILNNCIQYTGYCSWFTAVYERSVYPEKLNPVKEEAFVLKIALTKA
jgi:hypothetical protein